MNFAITSERLSVPRNGKILHIAPGEHSLVKRFRQAAAVYVPADLAPSRYIVTGMQRLDLMLLDEADEFDLIYASHVMEHVPDDGVVLQNLYKALKPGGQAWLIVPLYDGQTFDGRFDMSPGQREKLFGQWDHVRQYGIDFRERIERAGFRVSQVSARDFCNGDQTRYGLDEVIFVASKQ
ncbi:class I SAM-dependent methyltransferase [Rhizorhapis sp. SPR117]|uniref:class I SAM-dependent methyltransferase n=1 Tax=Rhizorhapis sp. SPR117 TaxID=2912611 RepID=UPI001F44A2F6|nr:class I SAM-dependent methyltransferase [Rhizorhapis sp. SPR117]